MAVGKCHSVHPSVHGDCSLVISVLCAGSIQTASEAAAALSGSSF